MFPFRLAKAFTGVISASSRASWALFFLVFTKKNFSFPLQSDVTGGMADDNCPFLAEAMLFILAGESDSLSKGKAFG